MRIARYLSAVVLLVASAIAGADEAQDFLQTIEVEFNSTPRLLREGHPLLSANYVEWGGGTYSYHLPQRFLRLAKQGSAFRIHRLKCRKQYIQLEVEVVGNESTKLELRCHGNGPLSRSFQLEVFPMMLRDLFEFREPLIVMRYTANTSSGNLHLSTANHLPNERARARFERKEDAVAAGFHPCPACFPDTNMLPIPFYAEWRREAIERARLHEIVYPPIEDENVQRRVREIGELLVEAYPFPLKGYDYSFSVIHSSYAQASAIPTGFVYVTDTAYFSAESDAELAFLIAHEIAHVEMDLLERLEVKSLDLEAAKMVYAARRRAESSADWVALWIVWKTFGREQAFEGARSALLKAAFGMGESLSRKAGDLDSHPSIGERLRMMELENVRFFEDFKAYCGLSEEGDVAVTVLPLCVVAVDGDCYLILSIEPSDLLNEQISLTNSAQSIRMTDEGGKKYWAGADEPFSVKPGIPVIVRLKLQFSRATMYVAKGDPYRDFEPGAVVEFELGGAKSIPEWVVCQGL